MDPSPTTFLLIQGWRDFGNFTMEEICLKFTANPPAASDLIPG